MEKVSKNRNDFYCGSDLISILMLINMKSHTESNNNATCRIKQP